LSARTRVNGARTTRFLAVAAPYWIGVKMGLEELFLVDMGVYWGGGDMGERKDKKWVLFFFCFFASKKLKKKVQS